jgi:hypothetical protein
MTMNIRGALIMAGAILALAFSLNLAGDNGLVEPDTAERAMGVATGLVLVVFANFMPKNIGPLSESRCEPGKGHNLRRFAAWTFVLAGLGHSIVWLTFPIPQAHTWAKVSVAAGFVIVVVAVLVSASRGNHASSES